MTELCGDRVRRATICGAGFIGRALLRRLAADGVDVSVIDHKPCPSELAGFARWHQGDFADASLLQWALSGSEVAYHLVSTTVPGDERVSMITELSDNIFATIRFIDTCVAAGVRRIVFVSSSSVYGLQDATPIPESAATDPISSHGIQKLTIEKYLLLARFERDLDVRIIRLGNPFGPGQDLYGRQGFVAIAIGKIMADEPLLLRAKGAPIRDFIFIDDVARALALVGFAAAVPPVMNLGTGLGHSLRAVVGTIEELLGRPVPSTDGPLRRADIPTSVLDATLLARSVGFRPSVSLAEGLEATLRHWHVL